MGLFSSKKKTYVSTSVNRVVEDNRIPDVQQKNLIDSIFKDQTLTRTIINNGLKSHTIKVERAFRYAQRGDYYYGTPDHNVINAGAGRDVVKNIIELELGQAVTLDYFHFAPANNLHVGWQKLTEDYGYNERTNEVTTISQQTGKKTWVKNLIGHINTVAIMSDATAETVQERTPDEGTLAVWERHPQDRYTPYRTGSEKTPVWDFGKQVVDGVTALLVDENGTESELFFNMEHFEDDGEAFQAKYRYSNNGQTTVGYFTYENEQGAYPGLDSLYSGNVLGNGSFLPIVFFRNYGQNWTAPHRREGEAYKSSAQLMNLLGMDYQELSDSIHANDDVDKLEQAVMMFGVPASSQDSVDKEYLYKFFDWLYKQSGATRQTGGEQVRPGQAIRIADSDYDSTLSFSKIRRKRVADVKGDPGTYHHQIVQEVRTRKVRRTIGSPKDRQYETVTESYTVDVLQYVYQRTATHYDEILIEDLSLRYSIYGSKGVTANVGSDKLLIPLDYYIARSFKFDRKERLYYRAMHFVMNSKVTKTVKWYETGIFKVVMAIVAIVFTIFSGGLAGPIATAWAAGAYATVALLVLQAVVTSIVTQVIAAKVLEEVVQELGYEVGIVLAVVAFAAGVYGNITEATWALAAIQAANGLVNASGVDMQRQIAEYRSESQEFQLMADEKMEELEEIDNLLNSYELLDPRSFVGQVPSIRLGEDPSSLYDRTVHVGNPGILQYDLIESHVAINTKLPTFHDLVGETFYGRI